MPTSRRRRLTLAWLPLAVLQTITACRIAPPERSGASSVRLIVEPEAGAGAVLGLMAAARESLWVEMYLLTSGDALDVLEERVRAGCDVRVVLDPAPYRNESANQVAYDRLAAAGADVRWATDRFRYSHAKLLIVDHVRAVVMTLNLTDAGLGGNREFAVVDDDPDDVAAAEAIFDADRVGAVAQARARIVTSPDTTRPRFDRLIEGAARTLRVQSEELVDPQIIAALEGAASRGVGVTVVWPGPPSSVSARLAAAGVDARAVTAPVSHAKATVADGTTCYVGSANLSPTSFDSNRELGLLLDDAEVCGAIDASIVADAARGLSP